MDRLPTPRLHQPQPAQPSPIGPAVVTTMAEVLDSLGIALCLFDEADRALLWNRSFLRLFPEHDGHVTVGEPYAENLRRFYGSRLSPAEMGAIDQCIAEGIARHRTQTQPYIFEHRGRWIRVASQPLPGFGRIRIWTPVAPPGHGRAPDPGREVLPFEGQEVDGRTLLGPDGRITWANDPVARVFGLVEPADAVGFTHADLLRSAWATQPGRQAEAAAALRTLAQGEQFTGVPFELSLPGDIWLRVLQNRLPDGRVASSFADISATKRLQHDLTAAREAAERANRAKDTLLATVSHELRTPLNAVIGMLALLDGDGLPPAAARRVILAHQASRSLMQLVDDILAFSRIESGQVAIDPVPMRPGRLLEGVAELLRPDALRKGLALRWSVAPETPALVRADEARLRQVLMNLVGNALKFTQAGEVAIEVAPLGPADGAPGKGALLLGFSVTDTGIGIPAVALPAIFAPFVQADPAIARRFGGTGLGLSISRDLVRGMGGDIEVTSEPGSGSRFAFAIPCAALEADALPEEAPQAMPAPRRVLVVDDEAVNREVAALLLGRLGMTVLTASGADEALRACAEPLDLVLMDVEMPEANGFSLAARLRASGLPGGSAPVVAMTGHAGEEHRRRAAEAGFVGHLAKPLDPAALAGAIAAVPIPARGSPADGLGIDAERVAMLAAELPAQAWLRLVAEFEASGEEAINLLAAAAAPGRAEAAHRLKGMAWNFGARRLGDLAAALEARPPGAADAALAELRLALAESLRALREAGRRP